MYVEEIDVVIDGTARLVGPR